MAIGGVQPQKKQREKGRKAVMENQVKKSVFLIGFMGVGKSSITLELGHLLGLDTVEMDDYIVQQEGRSIPEIFDQDGEGYFRRVERAVVVTLGEGEPRVISCGGGVPMGEENRKNMKQYGTVVLLTARPETIFQRVCHDQNRPLLKDHMNVEYIASLMAQRQPYYEQAADVTVSTDGKTPAEISREVAALLAQRQH